MACSASPMLANLRIDPFERAHEEDAMGYQSRYMEYMFVIAPAGAYVGQWCRASVSSPRGGSRQLQPGPGDGSRDRSRGRQERLMTNSLD
jgi:hypothetical protein